MNHDVQSISGGTLPLKQNCWGLILALATLLVAGSSALGADLLWTGKYRVEGVYLKNYTLDKVAGIEDSYIMHHLILEPKIIATDGLNLKARFDILNSGLDNDVHGQVFGTYNAGTTPNAQAPAVYTHTQSAGTIIATEVYLNWVNEFGALVVGRAPFSFGLGMVYNSGSGNFDHYISTKDMVGYKLVLGNISIFPAYGKVREGVSTKEDDVNDYIIVAEYVNPETDFSMGFMFDNRVAPFDSSNPINGNDIPASYFTGVSSAYSNAAVTEGFSAYNMNVYVKKQTENFNVGVELGFLNGSSGLKVNNASDNGALESATLNGFGLAGELGYKTGSVKLNLRAGYASGDDPDTVAIESYYFSPNYHVAMMMFDFPMGNYDVLRSASAGTHPAYGAVSGSPQANLGGLDTETITNAMYIAPNLTWSIGDHYDILGTFCYANTVKPAVSNANPPTGYHGNVGNSLGFETDFGFNFHPNDKFTWETTIGILFPGNAWSAGGVYNADMAYGATSKAAINF